MSEQAVPNLALETAHTPPPSSTFPTPNGESDVEYIKLLEAHRQACEEAGNYREAGEAHKRLVELRVVLEERKLEEMKVRHARERKEIREAHEEELEEFNKGWDAKETEMAKHYAELVSKMEARHAEERVIKEQEIEETMPFRPRWSKQLLNMRKVEKSLARQRKYDEAQELKDRADEREAREEKMLRKEHHKRTDHLRRKLKQHQAAELDNLQRRAAANKKELAVLRKKELKRVMQRYANVRADLIAGQQAERLTAQKYTNVPTTSRKHRSPTKASARGLARAPSQRDAVATARSNSGGAPAQERLTARKKKKSERIRDCYGASPPSARRAGGKSPRKVTS